MGASRVAEDAVACIGTLLLAFGVLAIAPDDPPSSRPTPVWTTVGGGGGVVGGGVVGGAKRLRNGRDANNGNEDDADADADDEDIAGPSDNAGRASKAPRRTERRSATAPSPPSALDAEESQSEWERRLLAPRPLNQTPAEDFESLPKELRSRGGLELYRAMTEQHDFSDLVGAFAIAHYVGGLGQARALEAMMACIEREGLVDLPRDVAGRAENLLDVLEPLDDQIDPHNPLVTVGHVAADDAAPVPIWVDGGVHGDRARRVRRHLLASFEPPDPDLPSAPATAPDPVVPSAKSLKLMAEEAFRSRTQTKHPIRHFVNMEAIAVYDQMRREVHIPFSGLIDEFNEAGDIAGVTMPGHTEDDNNVVTFAYVYHTFGFPVKPLAIVESIAKPVQSMTVRTRAYTRGQNDNRHPTHVGWHLHSLHGENAYARLDDDHVYHTERCVQNYDETRYENDWTDPEEYGYEVRPRRVSWSSPLVDDRFVYTVLRSFVDEGRVHIPGSPMRLRVLMDMFASRAHAMVPMTPIEMFSHSAYMFYANGISDIARRWVRYLRVHRKRAESNVRTSPTRIPTVSFESARIKLNEFMPLDDAVTSVSHVPDLSNNLVRTMRLLMHVMNGIANEADEDERVRRIVAFVKNPADFMPRREVLDDADFPERLARYAFGEDAVYKGGIYVSELTDDFVKFCENNEGVPTTVETWPHLRGLLFEVCKVVVVTCEWNPGWKSRLR